MRKSSLIKSMLLTGIVLITMSQTLTAQRGFRQNRDMDVRGHNCPHSSHLIPELTEEQEMMRREMEKFCERELSHEYVRWMDENVDFPPDELWQKFIDIGLFRAALPREYGGEGLGQLELMLGFEQICKASVSVANAVGATIGLGARFITELGTERQKEELRPDGRCHPSSHREEPESPSIRQ